LDNAFKYSAEDQPITLRLSTEKKDHRALAILRITNAPGNAGLPDPERVFAKYYRAPRAHEKTGSGLGLYLIQNIAKAMGGDLVFIPQQDLVIFELRVPLSLNANGQKFGESYTGKQ
jgi:signal transduction histidine kinase